MDNSDSRPYSFDGEIHWREGHGFNYSDSDESEEWLLEVLSVARDRAPGSEELARKIKDWPSYYHLAPQRCDLLRPLEHLLHGRVLEVGSGCGALTGFLAQHARSVIALEGSHRRARLTAARCRGLSNVEVYCDNYRDFRGGAPFDVVTSIGVLEYANRFFDGAGGFDRMIGRLARSVAQDGILVVAIENRLGLKYFAGAPEDHTGRRFDGIQDLYQTASVCTLGREELRRRLERQGLEICEWLYPCPDYKSPQLIISDDAFVEDGLDLGAWLRRCPHGYQDHAAEHLFSEALAWPVVARNGLVRDLANSFLMVARHSGSAARCRLPALLWRFETGRRRALSTELRVIKQDGSLYAERRLLYPESEPVPGIRIIPTAHERLPNGPAYDEELYTILNRPGWTVAAVAEWAADWLRFLRISEPSPLLTGCLPSCFVRRDTALVPWGVEVLGTEPAALDFAVFHGLYDALAKAGSCAPSADASNTTLRDLVSRCMAQLGLDACDAAIDSWLAQEAGLHHALTGVPLEECRRSISRAALPIRREFVAAWSEGFHCQVFWRTSSSDYSEEASRRALGHLGRDRQTLAIEIPPLSPSPVELRLDLADRPGVARLHGIRLSGRTGENIWMWDGSAESLQSCARQDVSFRKWNGHVVAELYGNDPIVILPVPMAALQALEQGAALEVELTWADVFAYLRETATARDAPV